MLQLLAQRSDVSLAEPWSILYHLGGNGPWIPKVSGIAEDGINPPAGCTVEQVHMVGLKL
jgi:acid phosphatase